MTDKVNATRAEIEELAMRFRDTTPHTEERVSCGEGYGYVASDGRICMVRCFSCGLENYAPTVSSGMCAWCTYDFNDEIKTASAEKLS